MKATKALVAAGLAIMLGAGSASAQDGKVGLGYQGIFGGSILNGVSGRYWFDKNWGAELNVFYGNVGVSDEIGDLGDGDLLFGTAKVMYAPVVKANSKFYVGVEGGLGTIDGEIMGSPMPGDLTLWTLSPFFGVEYSFTELPELGLNFEVGYKWHNVDYSEGSDELNVDLSGTFISLGAHYYL